MVNERTCHQHVILHKNLKISVSVDVCEELKYHKDTLQISKPRENGIFETYGLKIS